MTTKNGQDKEEIINLCRAKLALSASGLLDLEDHDVINKIVFKMLDDLNKRPEPKDQQWPEGHFNHPDFVDDIEPDLEAIAAQNKAMAEKYPHWKTVDSVLDECFCGVDVQSAKKEPIITLEEAYRRKAVAEAEMAELHLCKIKRADKESLSVEEWKDINGNLKDCLRKYHPLTQPVAHLQIKALIDKIDQILK